MMHGADQVGGKNEAAFEHRNNQQVFRLGRGDIRSKPANAASNLFGRKQDIDAMSVNGDGGHEPGFRPISLACAKRICSVVPCSGGAEIRVLNMVFSPGCKGRDTVSRVQL